MLLSANPVIFPAEAKIDVLFLERTIHSNSTLVRLKIFVRAGLPARWVQTCVKIYEDVVCLDEMSPSAVRAALGGRGSGLHEALIRDRPFLKLPRCHYNFILQDAASDFWFGFRCHA